ncbi:glycerophosphodiester phosphodiesterase family protein [Labilibacter sediminis]|nr:glycerophosphodiester phosphodiesterase family protein [Labilibacter sediminis]
MKVLVLVGSLFLFLSCIDLTKTPKQPSLEGRIELLNNPSDTYVMVAAHRGDWRNFPENSILAIESAINMGVDIVEVDIQKTKDGVFVLMHDETIDRTTNGKGKVSDYSYKELQAFVLRHGNGALSEEKIPTLKEALLAVKGKVLIDLDKAYGYINEVVPILLEIETINQALIVGPVSVSHLNYSLLENPDNINYIGLVSQNVREYSEKINILEKSNANPKVYEIILPIGQSDGYAIIAKIRANGDNAWVNSIFPTISDSHSDDRSVRNPDGNWGFLIEKGVTILQTDRPELLLQYLRKRGLHY